MDRMFNADSFNDLKDASEVKAAVLYFAHNEIKFENELASEGLSYDAAQKEVANIWTSLLKLCSKFKYSDYIVETKRKIYHTK